MINPRPESNPKQPRKRMSILPVPIEYFESDAQLDCKWSFLFNN